MCTTKRLDLTVFLICFFCLIQFQLKKNELQRAEKCNECWVFFFVMLHPNRENIAPGIRCWVRCFGSLTYLLLFFVNVATTGTAMTTSFFSQAISILFRHFRVVLNARKLWDFEPRYIVAFVLWVLGVLEILSYSFHSVCVFFLLSLLKCACAFFHNPIFFHACAGFKLIRSKKRTFHREYKDVIKM